MFGKKKECGIPVMHYEGISEFATDYPCRLELNADNMVIRRLKPETTVTLPRERISSISAMEEERFMLMYHNSKDTTSKAKGIKKYYLVITYDKGVIALWGTAHEYNDFLKMQTSSATPKNISL